ncbi:MAG: tRNA1(Val) (adenine(37)-N6)-methyltransferase [Sporomusaceae bacterium]|nr:tRNA1(Val) (adenine(37)-N6)-methyltransferase [Sporomusaceae bacterium]
MKLFPGERIDELFYGGYRILQHEEEFAFSLDAVLVAHFAFLRPKAKALDLGTGTGVIALLLAARGAGEITGIECNARMVDLARRSVALNDLDETIKILSGDYSCPGDFAADLPPGSLDLVIANPPYRLLGTGQKNAKAGVATARHEVNASLSDVLKAAAYWTKFRGRFVMVHLPERMTEILVLMHQAGLEPKRLRLVHPLVHKPANMMLVEGVRGGKSGLTVLPPLIVHEPDGTYTKEVQSYYAAKEDRL